MCLARPGKVIEVKEGRAVLDYGDHKREVKTGYIKPNKGDYVIVMNKQVIQKVPEEEAKETLAL